MIMSASFSLALSCYFLALLFTVNALDPATVQKSVDSGADRDDLASFGEDHPRTKIWDGKALLRARKRAAQGDRVLMVAVDAVVRSANSLMDKGESWTVMAKKFTPPSGTRHDFESAAPFYWPCNSPKFQPPPSDCNLSTGLPWVPHDGEANRAAISQFDAKPMKKMTAAVTTLAIAYFYSHNETYASKALSLLRQWFLDDRTAMNPNLNFASLRPGVTNGSSSGIIVTHEWAIFTDAIRLLSLSPHFDEETKAELSAWFTHFVVWLVKSKHGRAQSHARNNHGTWYDVQVSAYALLSGHRDFAETVAKEASARRIDTQIQPDGQMPYEEARTNSKGYCEFNLQGLFDLADLSRHSKINLFNYTSSDGRSIRKAIDFMIPYVTGEKDWPFKQINHFSWGRFFEVFRRAANAYEDSKYSQVLDKLPQAKADVINLIYPAEDHVLFRSSLHDESDSSDSYVFLDGAFWPRTFLSSESLSVEFS